MNMTLLETIRTCKVLPVVVTDDVERSVKLAQVLANAGMSTIELTLRTKNALACIQAIKEQVPEMTVAAGTVTNVMELVNALQAGAEFVLSPGNSETLIRAAKARDVLFIPGVSTASEIMLGREHDITLFKVFPAEAIGGVGLLKSLAGPFPDVQFCPTGGLNPENFREYLALDCVTCIGGSWMVKADMIEAGQWERIEELAREAVS